MKSEQSVLSYSKGFTDTMNLEGEQAFKFPFEKMSKMFGKELIDYLRNCWTLHSEFMTDEDFMRYNGIPTGYFNKLIKC